MMLFGSAALLLVASILALFPLLYFLVASGGYKHPVAYPLFSVFSDARVPL
jgi:hypothetical protein